MKKMSLKKLVSLLLVLVLTLGTAVPGSPRTVSASTKSYTGEASDSIPGNIIQNPEFENNDFATGLTNGKWYPNGATLSHESSQKNAGTYSLKVSGRTAYWSGAAYREWFGNLAYDKEYYIQGAVSASAAEDIVMSVQVCGYGGVENAYPTQWITMDSVHVEANEWALLSGSLKFTISASETSGKYDVTAHFGGQTYVVRAVDGLDNIEIFIQGAEHQDGNYPDLYHDSFLIKEGVAPHSEGENTESLTDNKITNSSFEANDFASDHNHGKWYKTTDSTATISQINNFSHSGNYSLKVSNRTAFWHRAQYRVYSGYLTEGTEYDLSGYVAASADTPVELIATVIGYGGPAENPYPTINMTLNTGTADSKHWEKLEGSFKITSVTNSADSSKKDITVSWGTNTQTITGVLGYDSVELFVQQPSSATSFPDLYLDSFAMTPAKESGTTGFKGHQNGTNTETDTENIILNSSFESNDLSATETVGKWYAYGPTISQYTDASQSGSSSLKVSDRTAHWHRAQYRVEGSEIAYEQEYSLSGYVAAESTATVDLMLGIWGYGGPAANPYPVQYITLDTGVADINGWTELASTFTITREASEADSSKYDLTITYGTQSVKVECVDGLSVVEVFVQEPYHGNTDCPDLYLDSFLLKAVQKQEEQKYPSGHQNGTNTEADADNMIQNSSFESADFASETMNGKWYNNGATISQFSDASQSGENSLRVTDRTSHWHRAEYRVEGSEFASGRKYALSGYVAAEKSATVDLMLGVWGYGSAVGNGYSVQYITLDTGIADIDEWVKLEGEFSIAQKANATNSEKYDLVVTYGEQTAVIEGVAGLSVIEIYAQEAYHDKTDCPDLYLDSFLLEDVTPEAPRPTGHTGAEDTSKNKNNLINNAGFENNDYATTLTLEKWYADPGSVSLQGDTTFSHSGNTSLLVSGREEHWNRATYQIPAEKLVLGHTYELSGYLSALEDANAELLVEVIGYKGAENNREYVSEFLTLDTADLKAGKWSKLAGEFKITQQKSEKEDLCNLVISWSGGKDVTIQDVIGLSAVRIMPQEAYNAATPRADLYLDSFLLEDITPAPEAPTGHSNQENTELLSDNLIKNGSFEKSDFVLEEYVLDKWYTMEGCPATLTQDSTFSHSGKASLKVSGREEFWHRAEYRVEGSNFIMGDSYEVAGYVSALEDTNVEMLLQVYAFGGPESNPYPNQLITVDTDAVKAGEWTKLSAMFKVTVKKNSEAGYYDYTITVDGNNNSYTIPHVKGLSLVQLMVQEAYSEVTPRTDLYLDSFVMRNQTKRNMPIPTGHVGAADTEDILGNLINNSSFESDLYEDEMNFGLWFTNAKNYNVEQCSKYSHSGSYSTRIFNRKAANHSLLYRVEGSNVELGTEYTLSGFVAAALKTDVELILTVYGYAGPENNRTYPSQTIVLDRETVKDWIELAGNFTVDMKDGQLYLKTSKGTVNIGKCLGLSNIEFYVMTDETVENYTTDLYLDTFSLIAGAAKSKDDGSAQDIQVSDFMQNKEDGSSLAQFMSTVNEFAENHVAFYVILIALGMVVNLGSIIVVVRTKNKRRKAS